VCTETSGASHHAACSSCATSLPLFPHAPMRHGLESERYADDRILPTPIGVPPDMKARPSPRAIPSRWVSRPKGDTASTAPTVRRSFRDRRLHPHAVLALVWPQHTTTPGVNTPTSIAMLRVVPRCGGARNASPATQCQPPHHPMVVAGFTRPAALNHLHGPRSSFSVELVIPKPSE